MTFIQSNCWIKHFTLTHKWNITKIHGTPVVPKILSSKNKTSRLSNAVSIILIAFLDQNVQNLKHSWFYSISRHIPKYEFFLEKTRKKLQRRIADFCNLKFFWTMKILFFKLTFSFENVLFSISREWNKMLFCFNRILWAQNWRHNYTHKEDIFNEE